ncbi:potassium voltage-gated channel protein egl-36 [Patella vulgata]|uniref:potassium voltage-gated channel protein egl-36 n=1 Tax=Patella vulgata TaxID=6465 RepID=UPI00218002EF|nr:potassium voltage-gated channel protein egl-36 [Patella vulgata]XP_055958052.1 potassium voltage-gated channel protein egl-36 [Patella vulgata]
MSERSKVRINIGGQLFVTRQSRLNKFPGSRLSRLNKDSDEFEEESGEYYFDRDPALFSPIMNLYRNHGLHLPKHVCGSYMLQELQFWEIPEELVSECCWKVLYKVERNENLAEAMQKMADSAKFACLSPSDAQRRYCRWKHAMWMLLSRPRSSFPGKIFNSLYLLMVLVSVFVFVSNTHPAFRIERIFNFTNPQPYININNSIYLMFYNTVPHPSLVYVDVICAIFFTLEWLLSFFTTPCKFKFMKNALNIIDVLVIICNWATLIIDMAFDDGFIMFHPTSFVYISYIRLKYISVMRILRFFKLAERFPSLHIMLLSVRKSIRELTMMTVCVFIIATLFGCALYLAEVEEETVTDIPLGIWWAIVTMTTVGYGDIYPKTALGRFVASCCAITGLLALSMPIAIIASNFNEYYTRDKERERRIIWEKGNNSEKPDL